VQRRLFAAVGAALCSATRLGVRWRGGGLGGRRGIVSTSSSSWKALPCLSNRTEWSNARVAESARALPGHRYENSVQASRSPSNNRSIPFTATARLCVRLQSPRARRRRMLRQTARGRAIRWLASGHASTDLQGHRSRSGRFAPQATRQRLLKRKQSRYSDAMRNRRLS
jgi:hypothetical protein